jgi:RNA polymerase sigma factor (sigma-70 family)
MSTVGAARAQRHPAIRDEDRVAAVMAAHGRTLLRVAHHWSICHDDALDAYQRALEIFLRRAGGVEPATEVAWLKVVVKHEALAIRRARSDSVAGDDVDLDARAPVEQRSVEEQIAGSERVSRSAEALRALKPDEARALMLKAQGLSYQEIGARCGWTYTKVNRAITEGRRRFLQAYAAIESGGECTRLAPVLEALAAGTATSAQVVEIRPHLRHCTACRATVRELHISRLRRVRLLLPPVLLPWWRPRSGGGDADLAEILLSDGGELVKPPSWLAGLRHDVASWLHRMNPSDMATGVQIASSTGGGRVATLGAIVGFCLSGIGAGTVCVVTGLVPSPLPGGAEVAKRPAAAARKPSPAPPARQTVVVHTSLRAAETPAPAPSPVARSRRRPEGADPAQGRGPVDHRRSPISPTARGATADFAFEQSAPGTASDPAAAPATGGAEFTP